MNMTTNIPQIGDVVKVQSKAFLDAHFLNIGGFCYLTHPVIFTPEMEDFCDKSCTVESISYEGGFIFAEDANKHPFPAEALIMNINKT